MNNQYYDFMNLSHYIEKKKLSGMSIRYLKEFVDLGTSMFTVEGLPEPFTPEILETALMFRNHLCWYQNDAFGDNPMLCQYLPTGEFDMSTKPTKVNIITLMGVTVATNVPYSDIILVKDNRLDIPLFLILDELITRISHIEDTLDVNMQLLRMPMIFTCDKKSVTQYKQLFKAIQNCDPFVLSSNEFAKDSTQSIPINLPAQPKDIYEIFDKYRNLAKEQLGISATIEKASRVQAAEVEAQNDYVNFVYNERKKERELWIKEYNKRYNGQLKLTESYDEFKRDDAELNAQKQVIINNATGENDNGGVNNGK